MSPLVESIPYAADSTELFLRLRSLGAPVWLDSARPLGERGRYDLISAAPLTVITAAEETAVTATGGIGNSGSIIGINGSDENLDPFARVESALRALLPPLHHPELPFTGGAIGLFGYEAGLPLHGIADKRPPHPTYPDLSVGIYSWVVVVDHLQQRTHLLIRPETPPALAAEIRRRLVAEPPTPPAPFRLDSPWRDALPADRYRQAFERIQHYIRAGDCYQVNLTRALTADCSGDPLAAYLALRTEARAPFSAYLESAQGAVLSFSPERLLSAEHGRLLAQPIKGTARRDANPQRDAELAQALLASEKNRAENLMIVDLLRNDLGHSCKPGSICVEQLFELQSFAAVHHLVSTISGELRDGVTPLQALRDSFPGGSITGAPKRRAMQIIAELEPHRRAVFCGGIGYLSSCGRMDFNIAIRTLLACGGEIRAWAGGGIVADSEWREEWQESENKISALLRALERL
jgi:para-aminobenzoate synthetase component 1